MRTYRRIPAIAWKTRRKRYLCIEVKLNSILKQMLKKFLFLLTVAAIAAVGGGM